MESEDFVFVTHDDWILSEKATYLNGISDYVDSIANTLWPLNKTIHDNPETGYKEFIAHDALTGFLEGQNGWKVTPSAYGLKTAWVAVWDSGKKGPVVSFNVEMDALEGIGHACGHNLIAMASLAAGLATVDTMKTHGIAGKVVLFGTPAEEGGGGKIKLLRAGAYSDNKVDISLITHPGIVDDQAMIRTAAYISFHVEYFGQESHAAASPWLGINALDAMVTAYNALSVLRQQTMPGDVIQGQITDGGLRPNIIHAHSAGRFVVRASTQARVAELKEKVDACFEAGAKATGAKLEMRTTGSYADHVPNSVLARSYIRYFNALEPLQKIPTDLALGDILGRTMASTDQGDISYAMPSLSATFYVVPGPDGNGPHSPSFAKATGTRAAFEKCLMAAKGLAGAAVDVLTKEGLLAEVKKEWRQAVKGFP